MPTGVIPRPLHDKGFGFIKPDEGGDDVFFHVRALAAGQESELGPGTRVSYTVQQGRKGPQAADVRVLEPFETSETVAGEEDIDWYVALKALAADARAVAASLDKLAELAKG